MKLQSRNGNDLYVADYVFVYEGKQLTWVKYVDLSESLQKKLREIGYGPSVYNGRPFLRCVFDNCLMFTDMTGEKTEKHYKHMRWALHVMEIRHNIKEGVNELKPVILSSFAGAKMGGKRFPVFFFGETDVLQELAAEHGFYKEMYSLPPATRFERWKKFLGDWIPFENKPRVRIYPIPDDGILWVNPIYAMKNDIHEGDKLVGPVKDRVHIPHDMWKLDADIMISPEGNKLKLSEEKLSNLLGYSPSYKAEKMHSAMLKIKLRDGTELEGRNPNFGLDLQATLGIKPRIDLTDTIKLLNFEIDADIKDKFFKYTDSSGKRRLNNLGQELFVNGNSLENPELLTEYKMVIYNDAMRKLRMRVPGEFAMESPLSYAPEEAKPYVKKHVIVRYSGGIPVPGDAVVWDHTAYVDTGMWRTVGGDSDGDLAFLFRFRTLKKILGKNPLLLTIDEIKEAYILPEKDNSPDERTDEIDTLLDILNQASLCGTAYNTGKIFVDACRKAGITGKNLLKIEVTCMSLVEIFIYQFKRKIKDKAAVTYESLVNRFALPEVVKHIVEVEPFFKVLRANGPIVWINPFEFHPTLDGLLMYAEKANPESKSFYETACALFKGLKFDAVDKSIKLAKEIENARLDHFAELEYNRMIEEIYYPKPKKEAKIMAKIPESKKLKKVAANVVKKAWFGFDHFMDTAASWVADKIVERATKKEVK